MYRSSLDSPTGGAGQQGLGISLFGRNRFVMPVRITDIGGANIRFLPNLPYLWHMRREPSYRSRIGPGWISVKR